MNKLNAVLYLLGVIFLLFAAKMWIDNSDRQSENTEYLFVNETLDLNDLFNSPDLKYYKAPFIPKSNHITALYMITSGTCSPCINEVISFNYFFDKNKLAEKPIQQVVLVLDNDNSRVESFVKTTEFITPVLYGYNAKYIANLRSFGNEIAQRQLLLIENDRQQVFFRILLKEGKMTPESYKKKILKKAEKAL